jgi:hypothetical protein
MKKITITFTQWLKEDAFNSEEYQDLVKGLQSGEFEKDLMDTNGNGFKFEKAQVTYSIEEADGEA